MRSRVINTLTFSPGLLCALRVVGFFVAIVFPETGTATLAHVVVCRQGSSAKVSKTKALAALPTSSISRAMMQIVSFRLEFADNQAWEHSLREAIANA
jgi:hypothetical protein